MRRRRSGRREGRRRRDKAHFDSLAQRQEEAANILEKTQAFKNCDSLARSAIGLQCRVLHYRPGQWVFGGPEDEKSQEPRGSSMDLMAADDPRPKGAPEDQRNFLMKF